ncbi:MAG: TlpA disulfide reductase family protein [Planctomycetota bacterium]|jgi:thiol-disulfide isomerase/thioredoxin|nr:TlpA disulfide reductase family protein [Planctomycetota bacterium]
MRLLFAILGCLLFAVPAAAMSVDELVQAIVEEIPEDELLEPGSTVLAERLDALAGDEFGLDQSGILDLRLRTAEAWLDAGYPGKVIEIVRPLLDDLAEDEPERERAGLALVAAWGVRLEQSEDPTKEPDAQQALAEIGSFAPIVEARALSVNAQRLMAEGDHAAALDTLDQALALLKDGTARSRVPVYALRVLAMEAAEIDPAEIDAWFDERKDDPAVPLVRSALLTDGQKLVGQAAPAVTLPYADREGKWTLTMEHGRPVLLYFFTTWADTCVQVTQALVQLQATNKDIDIVAISLDTKDTIGRLGDYRARFGIEFPITGEVLGWDGEIDDQFHVEAIPHLVLIGPDRRIAAVDLIGSDTQNTLKLLEQALQAQAPAPADPGAAGAEDIP